MGVDCGFNSVPFLEMLEFWPKVEIGEIPELPTFQEAVFAFQELPREENLNLSGYFQSERYFRDYREELLEMFSPNSNLVKRLNCFDFSGSTSIHCRRGDYCWLSQVHPPVSLEYLDQAINLIGRNSKFLIFSDDPQWCADNVCRLAIDIEIIDEDAEFSLYAMTRCQNNIIANSSFSWWGAWMNRRPDKVVVAPQQWFGPNGPQDSSDLVPEQWISL